MDKQSVLRPFNGILPSLKKEENSDIRYNAGKLEDTTTRERSQSQKDNTIGFHLCKVPGGVNFTETESSTVAARGWGLLFDRGRVSFWEGSGDGR